MAEAGRYKALAAPYDVDRGQVPSIAYLYAPTRCWLGDHGRHADKDVEWSRPVLSVIRRRTSAAAENERELTDKTLGPSRRPTLVAEQPGLDPDRRATTGDLASGCASAGFAKQPPLLPAFTVSLSTALAPPMTILNPSSPGSPTLTVVGEAHARRVFVCREAESWNR
jgi:hypothetical protein